MDVIFNVRDHCLSGVHGTLGNDTCGIDIGVNHTLTHRGTTSCESGGFIEKVGQNCLTFLVVIVPESAKQVKICHNLPSFE